MLREAFQDLNRLRQITTIAVRYGFGGLVERAGLRKTAEAPATGEEGSGQSPARRFRLLLTELGTTFVKLGQVLSTRSDLLPADFIEELSTLQDQVPPFSLEEVRHQVSSALGAELERLFSEFDPQPLAAASMAQVHRARTHDGAEVIVKVQRPGLHEHLRADLSLLRYVARLLESVVEELAVYSPTGIVDEFERAILEELDFLREAGNIKAFARTHADRPTIRIPRVYDDLTAQTVLTMEMLRAPNLSHAVLDEPSRHALAKIILDDSFLQLFEDGLFHGDPHPGNLLILDGPVLGLIDFGLVGRVTRQMQETLVSLVLAIGLKDAELVARLLYRLGTPDSRTNLMAFKADIEQILQVYLPASLKDVNARSLMRDLLNLAVTYRIRVPKEYAILSRAAVAVEGVLRSLYPDMPMAELFMPYAKKLLAERYDPGQLQGGLMKTLLRLQGTANELPLQVSQILLDLESGKFSVRVRGEQIDELNTNLRTLAMMTFVGLVTTGFIIGTFIAFASSPVMVGGLPIMGLLGVAATIFFFSTAVVRQTWRGFRKVSLRRLVGRGRTTRR